MEIKTYAKNNEGIKKIHEAINIFSDGEKFHDTMSRKFHMWGLQGFKRWHRVQSLEDRSHAINLQHYSIDLFSENLDVTSTFEPPAPLDIKEGLEAYLDWEISVYERVSVIINDLINLGYLHESDTIKKCLGGVVREIEKTRRNIQDFEKSNWDWGYIRIVDHRLHEKMKEIEGV